MPSEGAVYAASAVEGAMRQGEILSGIVQAKITVGAALAGDEVPIDKVLHPYVMVASQDCDLDLDFKARQGTVKPDKKIPNVLFCEVESAEKLKGDLQRADLWERIKINKDERYHFLQRAAPTQDALGEGLPELGIDFKRYFTIPMEELYLQLRSHAKRRCRLLSPYLEHLATRFCYYQCRVALPAEHESEPQR